MFGHKRGETHHSFSYGYGGKGHESMNESDEDKLSEFTKRPHSNKKSGGGTPIMSNKPNNYVSKKKSVQGYINAKNYMPVRNTASNSVERVRKMSRR